ncbi:MAG: PEP-CTERM sorting domain-containing protein [Phycisphaerae bacterium]|nr:PEP-CTERM sorting domain-containing protein [Phycisphaerae bacterium]
MSRFTLSLLVLGLILGCCGISSASVMTVSYPDEIALASTNWTDVISVPKFNPAMGDLQSVMIELTGTVTGSAGFESRDASPSEVTMELIAIITVKRPQPQGGLLVVTLPTVSETFQATAYDQFLDFGGTSGDTISNQSNTETEIATTALPADLLLFTGVGNINLPIKATGASSATGSGNLVMFFATEASAKAVVTYTYVPEPATIALMGLSSLVLIRRKRRS